MLSHELEEPDLPRKYVSIFDRWIGKENYGQLDCKNDAERAERNERLLSHWAKVFDRTPVFRLADGKVKLETDRESFLDVCRFRPDKPGFEFAFVLIPELGAYYKEEWDDTNVVWYSDEVTVQPLFDWAVECGLHVLDDWRAP